MNSILTEIINEKRHEISRLKKETPDISSKKPESSIRDFKSAISKSDGINLIAEIKFASPSAGAIREWMDPIEVGGIYEQAGAAAISLLTDKKFFKGDLTQLPRLKKAISLPIIRKDFIIDESQVVESFHWGADAILLIARILSAERLKSLLNACGRLGLAALTEVHDLNDLNMAVDCGAEIIGINNRDLEVFKVRLETTMELVPLLPNDCIAVSESGINNADDVQTLHNAGVHAVLVGSSLMKSEDIGKKTRELVQAGKNRGSA